VRHRAPAGRAVGPAQNAVESDGIMLLLLLLLLASTKSRASRSARRRAPAGRADGAAQAAV
jgi:hypothetical protein